MKEKDSQMKALMYEISSRLTSIAFVQKNDRIWK